MHWGERRGALGQTSRHAGSPRGALGQTSRYAGSPPRALRQTSKHAGEPHSAFRQTSKPAKSARGAVWTNVQARKIGPRRRLDKRPNPLPPPAEMSRQPRLSDPIGRSSEPLPTDAGRGASIRGRAKIDRASGYSAQTVSRLESTLTCTFCPRSNGLEEGGGDVGDFDRSD